jgi:hypothetical protein
MNCKKIRIHRRNLVLRKNSVSSHKMKKHRDLGRIAAEGPKSDRRQPGKRAAGRRPAADQREPVGQRHVDKNLVGTISEAKSAV